MRIDPAHVYRATLTSAERTRRRDLFVADAPPPPPEAAAVEAPLDVTPEPAIEAIAEPEPAPVKTSDSRELIALHPIALRPEDEAARTGADVGRMTPRYGYDVRDMSPRQMASLALDLYVDGILDFEEYSMLAFQPELHPDYNQTIGALTGEPAEPDRPRDFVVLWRDRLSFERRFSTHNPEVIQRSERITHVLHMIETPTSIAA